MSTQPYHIFFVVLKCADKWVKNTHENNSRDLGNNVLLQSRGINHCKKLAGTSSTFIDCRLFIHQNWERIAILQSAL